MYIAWKALGGVMVNFTAPRISARESSIEIAAGRESLFPAGAREPRIDICKLGSSRGAREFRCAGAC